MKFYIHTTGCKANQWDSYIIQEELINAGMKIANTLSQADLIVINACTVTEGADRDIRRFINRCRRLDHKGKIILVGCQPQAHQKDTFGVDLILGQNEKYFIKAFISENGNFIGDRDKIVLEEIPKNSSRFQIGKTRFFFKIQDGCNRFCSYCIVPYTRGEEFSRPFDDVLAEVRSRALLAGVRMEGTGAEARVRVLGSVVQRSQLCFVGVFFFVKQKTAYGV